MSVCSSSLRGYIWNWTLNLDTWIGVWCLCWLHLLCWWLCVWGGMSESVQCMHMCYPYALHLFPFICQGGISDLIMHFIWKVYCHYLHYEILNTEQCRLLYVVSLSLLLHILIAVFGLFMCNCTWMMIYE